MKKIKKNHVVNVKIEFQKAFNCVKTEESLQNKIRYYSKSKNYQIGLIHITKIEINLHNEIINNLPISKVQGSNLDSKMFNFINEIPNNFKFSKSRFSCLPVIVLL